MGSSLEHSNWFIEYIAYKTGNGDFIDFWCDRWLDPVLLCGIFGSLFLLAYLDRFSIGHNGFWADDGWKWRLALQTEPIQQKEALLLSELLLLHSVQLDRLLCLVEKSFQIFD